MERIADFVSKNAEENVAVAFRPVRIASNYLSDRLIDGLVKAGYFRKGSRRRRWVGTAPTRTKYSTGEHGIRKLPVRD
jgi:hypothetical protein